jgi:hypothetical protein
MSKKKNAKKVKLSVLKVRTGVRAGMMDRIMMDKA